MEDVRVCVLYKGNLEWSGNQYIAASVKPVPNVPGVISTASDYVYDEAEHGPILAQLLQGRRKHHGRRRKGEELIVELESEPDEEEEESSIEIEKDASSDESNNDTAVLEKEEMELEQELRKELGEENKEHDEVKNEEHRIKKQGGSYRMRQLSSEDIEGAIDDGELSMDGEQFQKLVSKERYDFDD